MRHACADWSRTVAARRHKHQQQVDSLDKRRQPSLPLKQALRCLEAARQPRSSPSNPEEVFLAPPRRNNLNSNNNNKREDYSEAQPPQQSRAVCLERRRRRRRHRRSRLVVSLVRLSRRNKLVDSLETSYSNNSRSSNSSSRQEVDCLALRRQIQAACLAQRHRHLGVAFCMSDPDTRIFCGRRCR